MSEIHVGDIGTIFERTVKDQSDVVVDCSAATVKKLIFKKPDGTVVEKTAAFTTNGADGKLRYTTTALTDLDQAGPWQLEVYVELPSGKWHSSISNFMVYGNLN